MILPLLEKNTIESLRMSSVFMILIISVFFVAAKGPPHCEMATFAK